MEVPALGAVLGLVKAKLPATLALPPLNVAFERFWPKTIGEAVGSVLITGVPLLTAKLVVTSVAES